MENYERLQEIGKGSYGSVYKIKRKSDGQILVWKELDYGKMSEREKSQVVQEVNILSQLNHPNIVKYYDKIVEKESKRIYIIMEYCQNGDMAQLIKKCKQDKDFIAEDVIWKIFVQIILALRECHNRKEGKVLHRDLKPGNVFLDGQNNVKLGDFGLSRILSQESQYAHTNVGTPYYMSPEQINEAQYNEKTDIWSTGCILYEIIALRPPFEASNHLALAKRIIQGQIERIPERYSEDLQNIIQWMLSTDPDKRPSVDQLSEIPKIRLRMSEREMRDQYTKLKSKDADITKRFEELKKKEEDIKQREEAMKLREQRAQELKLKLSQASSMKFNDLYYSVENQKTFEKMLDDSQKENKGIKMNFYGKKSSDKLPGVDQNDSMDNKYYQTTSQSSVTELLKKARQHSNSNNRPLQDQQSATCELNDHAQAKRIDSSSRLFGDVSIASSIDVTSSTQMLGTGKKLTLMQYSTTSGNETPTSKDAMKQQQINSANNDSGLMIQNSIEFNKVPLFSLKSSLQQQQQRDGSLNKIHMNKRDDSGETSYSRGGQQLQESDSYYKTSQGQQSNGDNQKPPNSNGQRSAISKKSIKVASNNQQSASNIFQQINAQIQNGCPPRVQSAIPKGDQNIRTSQQQLPPSQSTQKISTAQLQIPNNLAEKLAMKDMEQPSNGRSSNLQRRPSSSACNSLTRAQTSTSQNQQSQKQFMPNTINSSNSNYAQQQYQTQVNFYTTNNNNSLSSNANSNHNSTQKLKNNFHHQQNQSMGGHSLQVSQ